MSIAQSLILAHGGTIEARSPGRDRGTIIIIRLPLSKGLPAASSAAEKPLGTTAPAIRRRILVVDDNVDGAELVAAFLEDLGYETQIASDGPEALSRVESALPDVAILDLGLPGMDGYELARELRARLGDRAPRLIALSGYAQASDRARAASSGFQAHFAKPVDFERLIAAIEAEASARI